MATINPSSGQGALFELVARGMKDHYFVKDDPSSDFPYHSGYHSATHHLAERRTIVPLNQTAFGSTFEVELDTYGDILTECAFEIDLPTWYPRLFYQQQSVDPRMINQLYSIRSVAGNRSYGYVNHIGYLLFERIQFYQDQILIQEWSGDGLLARDLTEGTWCSSYLSQQIAGNTETVEDTTGERAIQLRATPGHLKVRLPLPGMQEPQDQGLPLCAMSWQRFRIRATLRKVEDIVVCSDSSVIKPAPWNESQGFWYEDEEGGIHTFQSKGLMELGSPVIHLSTRQHYVPEEVRIQLREKPIRIPFRKQFEHVFSIAESDYAPLDKGSSAIVTRRLDGRHPTERIFWFFRNSTRMNTNRLDDFRNEYFDGRASTITQPYPAANGSYYYRMKFLVAGKEREDLYGPDVWQDITAWAKDERPNGKGVDSMRWSASHSFRDAARQPEGTVNFSTADRPTLYVELTNIEGNPLKSGQRFAEWRVFSEGWCGYEIEEGRGRLMFAS